MKFWSTKRLPNVKFNFNLYKIDYNAGSFLTLISQNHLAKWAELFELVYFKVSRYQFLLIFQ